jgi:hypothetical protein
MRMKYPAFPILILCPAFTGYRSAKSPYPRSSKYKSPLMVEINGSPEHLKECEQFARSQNIPGISDRD